jgi:hypothetical protein
LQVTKEELTKIVEIELRNLYFENKALIYFREYKYLVERYKDDIAKPSDNISTNGNHNKRKEKTYEDILSEILTVMGQR